MGRGGSRKRRGEGSGFSGKRNWLLFLRGDEGRFERGSGQAEMV